MKLDWYVKMMLTVIAVCLVILVVEVLPDTGIVPVAHADGMTKINYAKDGGTGVACSQDGKYIFVAGNEGIIVSDDYGRVGSWQKVVKED